MGFSPQWLGLREPADLAARDGGLLAAAAEAAGPAPVIVDLGAGTGSTVRALGPALPDAARWRLVDFDPSLLALVGEGGSLIDTHCIDLTDLSALPLTDATLVSASALLDLVSHAWLEALGALLAERRLPFYAALSYDGVMQWDPPSSRDETITAAFNENQRGAKSFGRALGPDACGAAETIFKAHGYTVATAPSPWLLGPGDAALQAELLTGIANAASEAGHDGAGDWMGLRIGAVASTRCRIGHLDLLALPPGAG